MGFGRRRAGKAPRSFPIATHQPAQESTPGLNNAQVPSEREDSIDLQTEKWDIGAAGSTLG